MKNPLQYVVYLVCYIFCTVVACTPARLTDDTWIEVTTGKHVEDLINVYLEVDHYIPYDVIISADPAPNTFKGDIWKFIDVPNGTKLDDDIVCDNSGLIETVATTFYDKQRVYFGQCVYDRGAAQSKFIYQHELIHILGAVNHCNKGLMRENVDDLDNKNPDDTLDTCAKKQIDLAYDLFKL